MYYILKTKGIPQKKKVEIIDTIMKETGLKLRIGCWYAKVVDGNIEVDEAFDFPKTPYMEWDSFGENCITIRKITNMTEQNREGLVKIIDEIYTTKKLTKVWQVNH